MIRSGFLASAEPAAGVFQPSTQLPDAAARVGGGFSGTAGGVGDASAGVDGNGDGEGEGEGVGKMSSPPQEVRSISTTTIMRFFI